MIDCGFALHSAFGIPAKVVTALYQLLHGCMVPLDTAAVSAHALCTCHPAAVDRVTALFEATVIRRVHLCLAVTCRLHLWQNDRDLLRATAVTRAWDGYRNKSQHRKLTAEKEKKISRRASRDSNPRPFDHEKLTDTGEENYPAAPAGD